LHCSAQSPSGSVTGPGGMHLSVIPTTAMAITDLYMTDATCGA
jgi:hypothetical protein